MALVAAAASPNLEDAVFPDSRVDSESGRLLPRGTGVSIAAAARVAAAELAAQPSWQREASPGEAPGGAEGVATRGVDKQGGGGGWRASRAGGFEGSGRLPSN